MTAQPKCPFCGKPSRFTLDNRRLWEKRGAARNPAVQAMLDQVTPNEQRMLISNAHTACYDHQYRHTGLVP